MPDTIFGRIIRKEIAADIVYESDDVLAFRDIKPQAPVHVLIVPKEPIASIADATPDHEAMLGRLLSSAAEVGRILEVADSGYRLIINHGNDGGQEVAHLHVHLLAGRAFGWPPG
ncbi:histidine triad nucleotide-binding protein [Candidatus Poribacteria bacterium]|nr:histidine triad nucleotide-binding protein [Candidatus Poribacteria bacterium]